MFQIYLIPKEPKAYFTVSYPAMGLFKLKSYNALTGSLLTTIGKNSRHQVYLTEPSRFNPAAAKSIIYSLEFSPQPEMCHEIAV
jgi:hypothetical protein